MATAVPDSYRAPGGNPINAGKRGKHRASGALSAGASALSAAAAVQAGSTAHTASGALIAQHATVVGSGASSAIPTGLIWQFADGATLYPVAGASIPLATDVPAGAIFYPSPDLLPGQSLSQTDDVLSLVSDSSLPATDSNREVVIEVLDSPMATARIVRTGQLFGPGQSGNFAHIQYAMNRMQDGDTLEISPGYIYQEGAGDGSYSPEACCLNVYKSCTIKGMDGKGRWKCATPTPTVGSRAGIVISSPSTCYSDVGDNTQDNPRKTITIQDFDFDNWGNDGSCKGIRIRNDAEAYGSYANFHAEVTIRNFKMGKQYPNNSGSGIGNAAELLTLENGHIYDIGDSIGQEHNIYVSARVMTIRGCRFSRTWGWATYPDQPTEDTSSTGWNDNNKLLRGHILKVSAVTGTVEGCAFDCNNFADASAMIQMKAGGNWTVRGNIFRDGRNPDNSRGGINMCRETPSEGHPNFEWWAGSEGNSLLFEKNVWIGHYPRPIIYFFTTTENAGLSAIYPNGTAGKTTAECLQSLVVRDNIAMISNESRIWEVTGFPGTNNALFIADDPNGGTNWEARGNTVVAYDANEAAFINRAILQYKRLAGPIAANAGTVATYRFTWPHGSVERSDAYQGAG